MRALITGGAGFIGSHLVDRLLSDGLQVRVLDDFSTGKESNLPTDSRLEIMRGDAGDLQTMHLAMAGIDWVFHEAAIASVPKTLSDPVGTHRANYMATLNVLEAARHAGVKRVVFAATAAAYGDQAPVPQKEEMPVNPVSPYAVDKVASEHMCQVYWRLYGLETVCLRYFNVFGPRQDPTSPYSGVISIFATRIKDGSEITIYGDGEQTRDFVYVADVVEANICAAAAAGIGGRVLNVGTGRACTLNQLLSALEDVSGCEAKRQYVEPRVGDIRHSCADNRAARDLLGWHPAVTLTEGLLRLHES